MSTSTDATTTAPSGRPISVLERARALEARSKSCGTKAKPVVGPSTSRAATFVPSKAKQVAGAAGTGPVGAPRGPVGAASDDMKPRSSRYASIARLLDDAEKSAQDVPPPDNCSLAPTKIATKIAPQNKSGAGTTKKKRQTLGGKIASDKSRIRGSSSSTSGSSKSSTAPAFLSRAVASWNRAERHFDRLDNSDSDPSSEEEGGENNDDDVSDDDDDSKASTNCTGSTHTSVTNSFTAASSVTTIGGDTATSGKKVDQNAQQSDSETDDDELSGYSWSRVGISARPVSIDSPPTVIRSKMPPKQPNSSAELHFPAEDRSSDEETAIHDNTTTTITTACNTAPSPASASSNGSVDSTKATVTKQPSSKVDTADQEEDIKLKPLWQCRLEDMRLRQGLAEELMRRDAPLPPPPRTELPAKMHRQVVAGEEDWSKDFAEETFVAFDDDIFGRREI